MTEADIHRDEWIAERAAILEFEAGMPANQAYFKAISQWMELQRSRNAQEPAK